MYYQIEKNSGWIVLAVDNGVLVDTEFFDIYIAAFYWIITTFTSVGYGDIFGNEPYENLYQMVVEMVGICFFSYMIGTVQSLIQGITEEDFQTQQEEKLDHWLMSLDKAVEQRTLISSVFLGVRNFH